MPTKTILKIDWATHEAARYACENWHYSKSVPVPPLVKIGVWENDKFIGVVLFSRGASPDLSKPYGLSQLECCELTRIALYKHETPVSRIMAVSIRFLKKRSPNLRMIVSFADPNENHHGGIYQATNWVYTGKSSQSFKYIDASGREWHSRQVSSKGYNIQMGLRRVCPKPSDCTKVIMPGKHRYLMPLDDEMRKKIQSLSKPYPKRAGSRDSAAPGFQSGEGGAIPTSALQTLE